MASLARYSSSLQQVSAPARPAPGIGARWFGYGIYVGIAALVVAAAIQTA